MSDKKKKVLERIKKILSLANNNTNEHEATLAALRARELMKKHSIEQREVEGGNEDTVVEKRGHKQNYNKWEIQLALALSAFLPIEILVMIDWRKKKRPLFIGEGVDVDVALSMYEYLRKTLWRLGDAQGKGAASRSFCTGAVFSIHHRLQIKKAEEEAKAAQNTTGEDATYALICTDKENQVADYMTQKYANVEAHKIKHSKVNEAAYRAGVEAGRSIGLDKQIQG